MPNRSRASTSCLAARVPQGKGELSFQVLEEVKPVLLIEVQDHLDVAGCPEAVSAFFQVCLDLLVIEDLTVGADMDCRVFIGHRLRTCGEIYYGEPPVAEDNRIVPEDALAVRTPVDHARKHSAKHLLLDFTNMVLVVDAYDSAHCFTP